MHDVRMQKPSIGRIVHYHYENTEGNPSSLHHAAAMVIEVHSDSCVTLEVMFSPWAPTHETSLGRIRTSVLIAEQPTNRQCTWPPRV